MGCAPDAEVKDHDFYAFFSTKPRVTRIGEGRIRMVGNGIELILERPELRRRADPARPEEIQGRWIPQFIENFTGSGMSGFSMEEPRGVVTITDRAIGWSGCPRRRSRYPIPSLITWSGGRSRRETAIWGSSPARTARPG
jgi:hypothetical protein